MALFKKNPEEKGGFIDRLSVGFIRLLGKLPWNVAIACGGFIGHILARVPFAKPNRITRINLSLCMPEVSDAERKRLTHQSLVMMVKNIIAGAVSWVAPLDEMHKKIAHVEGEDLLRDAEAKGQGIIFISPHIGCWEFLNFYLCSKFDLIILAKPFGGPALNDLIYQGRARLRGTMTPTNEKGVRMLLSALKKGGTTCLAPDHVPKETAGIFAPFFGISTTTGVLTSRLIQKTGVEVLAVSCTMDQNNTFLLRFIPADKDVYSADLLTSVAGVNRTVENCIRQIPEQYQWAYRRFKKVQGRSSPY